MLKDRIVENVRRTREKILRDANYDLSKVLKEIQDMQVKDKDKVVSFARKKTLFCNL